MDGRRMEGASKYNTSFLSCRWLLSLRRPLVAAAAPALTAVVIDVVVVVVVVSVVVAVVVLFL